MVAPVVAAAAVAYILELLKKRLSDLNLGQFQQLGKLLEPYMMQDDLLLLFVDNS